MQKIATFLILMITPLISAQVFDGYIEKLNEKVNLKLMFDNDQEEYDFDNGEVQYSIIPNTSLRSTLSFNYRFISFKLGYSPKMFESDIDHKGKTKIFKMQTDMYFDKWIQTLEYSKVNGFYLSDLSGDIPTYPDVPEFVILPDFKSITYRSVTRYRFNERFSAKAIGNQTEIQRKSTGSFIPGLAIVYTKLGHKTAIQNLNTFSMILNAGYFYTYVINKTWFISGGISPGFGAEFNQLKNKTESETKTTNSFNLALNLYSHLGVGYNSTRLYGGFNLFGNATSRSDNPVIKFDTTRAALNLYIGYHFKAPSIFKKGLDWVEEKSPVKL